MGYKLQLLTMVGPMHALQHLHVAFGSCPMSRGIAVIVLHSQAARHQLMQALEYLDIVRVKVMLRVRRHTVMVTASVF